MKQPEIDIIDHHIANHQRDIENHIDELVGTHARLTTAAHAIKLLPSTPATDSTVASLVAEREAIMDRIREIRNLLSKPCGGIREGTF
jgi:hypothetical protein